MLDGRPGAFHSSEIAFVFDNADRCVNLTGGLPEVLDLSTTISRAWVHFARHGDPGHPGLPAWPAVSDGEAPDDGLRHPVPGEGRPRRRRAKGGRRNLTTLARVAAIARPRRGTHRQCDDWRRGHAARAQGIGRPR